MKKFSGSSVWIQIVLWLLLALLPIWIQWLTGEEVTVLYLIVLGMQTLTWMLMFYLNYLYLIPRLLFRHRVAAFMIYNLIVGAVVPLIVQMIFTLMMGGNPFEFSTEVLMSIGTVWLMLLFLIFTALSLRSMQRNRKLEAERDRRERELASNELERLKSQLNPHFLFNSLNNISALSAIDTEATQEAIGTLSSMLRYVLYETAGERVNLDGEVKFMKNYISLMRLRYTDRLHIETEWPEEMEGQTVAPLLFISLIENAFKYGASSTTESRITMSLQQPSPGELTFIIVNTINGQTNGRRTEVDPGAHGVGLKNLQRRLELLYPGSHELECGPAPDGNTYRAVLRLLPLTADSNKL